MPGNCCSNGISNLAKRIPCGKKKTSPHAPFRDGYQSAEEALSSVQRVLAASHCARAQRGTGPAMTAPKRQVGGRANGVQPLFGFLAAVAVRRAMAGLRVLLLLPCLNHTSCTRAPCLSAHDSLRLRPPTICRQNCMGSIHLPTENLCWAPEQFISGDGGPLEPLFHTPREGGSKGWLSFLHVFHVCSMTKPLAPPQSVPVPVPVTVSLQRGGGGGPSYGCQPF